jgi:hypothetical protein
MQQRFRELELIPVLIYSAARVKCEKLGIPEMRNHRQEPIAPEPMSRAPPVGNYSLASPFHGQAIHTGFSFVRVQTSSDSPFSNRTRASIHRYL